MKNCEKNKQQHKGIELIHFPFDNFSCGFAPQSCQTRSVGNLDKFDKVVLKANGQVLGNPDQIGGLKGGGGGGGGERERERLPLKLWQFDSKYDHHHH